MRTALTIAGSDSSGGAGIQADIKTMMANGVFAMSAITAMTAQNTTGVTAIMNATPEFLSEELDEVFTDIFPDAVKIGMVSESALIHVIAEKLRHYAPKFVVVDPVMVATSGARLISEDAIEALKAELLPIAAILTPNIPETEVLAGMKITRNEDRIAAAEKISEIENKLTELEQKYPEIVEQSMDSETSIPGDSAQAGSSEDSSVQKFPAFEGKDLDGNPVKSDELFSGNAVTVVNFWFTTCSPCVGELGELDALNKELAEKNGALIGVNSFTLDGNEAEISEAKDVLAKKGATYQNVYFDSDSEAGRFTTGIYAYPTTYVVDRNGNIVGDPIVGAITEKNQAETLQKLIDQAIASDTGENEE